MSSPSQGILSKYSCSKRILYFQATVFLSSVISCNGTPSRTQVMQDRNAEVDGEVEEASVFESASEIEKIKKGPYSACRGEGTRNCHCFHSFIHSVITLLLNYDPINIIL